MAVNDRNNGKLLFSVVQFSARWHNKGVGTVNLIHCINSNLIVIVSYDVFYQEIVH